jgi:hypothetical protein
MLVSPWLWHKNWIFQIMLGAYPKIHSQALK